MAGYQLCGENAQLATVGSEAGQPPRGLAKAKQWRRVGLGLAFVCAMGTMVYSLAPRRHVTPMERLSLLHQGILSVFEEVHDDDLTTAAEVSLSLTDEAGDSEPSAMGVEVYFQGSERGYKSMQLEFLFSSKPKQAQALARAFRSLLKTTALLISLKDGAKKGMQIKQLFDIRPQQGGGDAVNVTVKLPFDSGRRGRLQSFNGEKPRLQASLFTGHTLEQIWNKKDESCATVHGGVRLEANTSLPAKFVKALAGMHGVPDELSQAAAVASLSTNASIKYRAERLAAASPRPLDFYVQSFLRSIGVKIPHGILKGVMNLKKHANGLNTLFIRGLPGKWEVVAEFTSFHITPVLSWLASVCEAKKKKQRHWWQVEID